jgi:hypothetical protein
MPIDFNILAARGLVYVRYWGFARLDESFEAFGRYAADPGFAPGQKQLVDLSAVSGFETDYPRLFLLQAEKAAVFLPSGTQTMIAYYAPTPVAFRLASLVRQSWEDIDTVVPTVLTREDEALGVLGQPERRFADLMAVQ